MPLQPAVLGTARLNNFRLNYLTAAQAADRPYHLKILIGGVDVTVPGSTMRVIYKSVTIRDVLFDAPNMCALTFYGAAPTIGQRIEIWFNSNTPALLFSGEIQTVERTYKGRPTTVLYPCTGIDDTAAANRKRPLRPYVNVSASTIAQELIAAYCPGFSSAGVAANLPVVTVNFDGSEGGLKGCLTQLAKLVGGYWYFENKTLYLFQDPPGTPPDPLDTTPGRFLHDPAITRSIDKSQVRTRVYGKGASTRIMAPLVANTTLVPVELATMFNPAGGKAIAAQAPDGAASRVLTYAGVQLGGGGGLVGPGAAPSSSPGLALLDGTGIESGAHRYAYTFVTAAGETLAGPVSTITVGPIAAAAVGPVPGAVQTGGNVDPGTYQYALTFMTAVGETPVAVAGPPVTTFTETTGASAEIPPPNVGGVSATLLTGGAMVPGTYYYRIEYVTANGSTGWRDAVNLVGVNAAGATSVQLNFLPTGPAGVTGRRIYRTVVNEVNYLAASAFRLLTTITNNTDTTYVDTKADSGLGGATIPTVNTTAHTGTTTHYQTVPLSGLAIGPANVTARRIYRWWSAAVGWKLVATIANNTATTFTDTIANASLGASPPVVNTAIANRVAVTLPTGGATVTARKLYRSIANAPNVGLIATIANNTATSHTDAAPDATVGAVPPTVDTSGLTQPSGQVPAGSTTIIVANAAPFLPGGGWAIVGNGDQVIFYSGTTANSLTGIPSSGQGALVAAISYNSTITAAPSLVGVVGLLESVVKGSPIHVWVQRDDLAAQAAMIALDGGGDGIYEHIVSDERRTEASLTQICEAQLALYSRPLVAVTYATRDLKTKSGKTIAIDLPSPAIVESLTIQDVTISEIGIGAVNPKFTVTASSVHHTFEAVLRMLIRNAEA